jgi:flagellar L-ring protein precursor FlgH
VTVLIDEFILASANKNQSATQERDRNLGLTAGLGSSSGSGGLKTQNDVGDRQRGESSRQQRFSGEISARVVEVSPSGMVRVEGTKKLQIDEVEEEVTIRGWIRPQDLSLQNTVESWRLSDAEILYASNGSLGETKGFWTRLLNKIWP